MAAPLVVAVGILTLTACAESVPEPSARACASHAECESGESCRDGYCTPRSGLDRDAGPAPIEPDSGVTPEPAEEELCENGRDDDGDTEVDEGCPCEIGTSQPCYGGAVEAAGVGTCVLGRQTCEPAGEFGRWGRCEGWAAPEVEACDGADDDCDGTADEGCECRTGESRSCYAGPEGTEDVGACFPGTETCTDGAWGPCEGARLPEVERCDHVDNDCDAVIDEGCGTPTIDCRVADVLLLVDTTGSMSEEIAEIQARLRDTIVPGLAAEIADVRFAVARFDDFPVGVYGSAADLPFELVQPITSSVAAAQAAVDTLYANGGSDGPESQVEALYQVATGAGIAPWVSRVRCASGFGSPCFRPGATPIILLFTDADFHNAPGGAHPYSGVSGAHTYEEALGALRAVGARVLGLMSGSDAHDELTAIARDTGALAADGSPIVFDIGSDGRSLSTDVVRAVQSLCR